MNQNILPSLFAVIGNPIAHSLSPLIHTHFAQQTHRLLQYKKIEVTKEALNETVLDFFLNGGKGLNITAPFKAEAFILANIATPRCLEAKAANTLWMKENLIYADNTDGIGLLTDLNRYVNFEGKKILILGAGGAVRGILSPLLRTSLSELAIYNRTFEKAKQLEKEYSHFPALKAMEVTKPPYDIIINASSKELDFEKLGFLPSIIHRETFFYDLAYSLTAPTPFLIYASKYHCTAVDGLGMLVEQAAESFYQWHGVRPDTEKTYNYLRQLNKK